MGVPAIAVAAIGVAGSVGGSLATGYAYDKVFGDGNYTKKEMAVDVALGVAGVGLAKGTGKLALGVYATRRGKQARKAGKMDEAIDYTEMGKLGTRKGAIEIGKVVAITESVEYTYNLVVGGNESIRTAPSQSVVLPQIQQDPQLTRDHQLTKAGRSGKKRCTRKYRGRQCVRTWPHPGKHMYV